MRREVLRRGGRKVPVPLRRRLPRPWAVEQPTKQGGRAVSHGVSEVDWHGNTSLNAEAKGRTNCPARHRANQPEQFFRQVPERQVRVLSDKGRAKLDVRLPRLPFQAAGVQAHICCRSSSEFAPRSGRFKLNLWEASN
jgi:hypothetical protein